MSRWLLAARLARREVRRHLGRSLLVVIVIALPVLGAQGVAIAMRSHQVADESSDDPAAPGADSEAGFHPNLGPPPVPEGVARAETSFRIQDWVQATEGRGQGPDDLADVMVVPDLDGLSGLEVTEGRRPERRDEVVLGEELAAATGSGIGDDVTLLGADQALTVVGIAPTLPRPALTGSGTATVAWVGPPVAGEDWVPGALTRIRDSGTGLVSAEMFVAYWLTDEARAAQRDPWATDEGDARAARVEAAGRVVIGAALAAMGVGLVAVTCSAAFAIGARRQLRQLGSLAAAGAGPADLRRAVFLQGTTLGALGAVAATALAYAARAGVVRWLATSPPDGEAAWVVARAIPEVLAVGLLGVAAGTCAALVPAWSASRVPVLTALAGRRPRSRRRALGVSVAGAVTLVAGLALLAWSTAEVRGEPQPSRGAAVAVAVLLTMAGGVALAPALVAGAAGAAARVGRTAHLAGRDMDRAGLRTSAVVASAAVVLAVPVIVLVWSARVPGSATGDPDLDVVAAELADIRAESASVYVTAPPGAMDDAVAQATEVIGPEVIRARTVIFAGFESGTGGMGLAVDPDALRATGDDALADLLDDGRLVTVDDRRWADLTVHWGGVSVSQEDAAAGDAVRLPAATVSAASLSPAARALMSQTGNGLVARGAGAVEVDGSDLLVRRAPLTGAEVAALEALSTDDVAPSREAVRTLASSSGSAVVVEAPWVDRADPVPWGLVGVVASVLLALAVIATSLALAAADGRADDLVVAAVGAPPTIVRRRRTVEATLTAACAALLAVAVGSAATIVVSLNPARLNGLGVVPTYPFGAVAAVAVGAVVAIGGATWLAQAASDAARGRRDLVLTDG